MKFKPIPEKLFGKKRPRSRIIPKVTLLATFAILLFFVTRLSNPFFGNYSVSQKNNLSEQPSSVIDKLQASSAFDDLQASSASDDLNQSTSLVPSAEIKNNLSKQTSSGFDDLDKSTSLPSAEIKNNLSKQPSSAIDDLKKSTSLPSAKIKNNLSKRPSSAIDDLKKSTGLPSAKIKNNLSKRPSSAIDDLKKSKRLPSAQIKNNLSKQKSSAFDDLKKCDISTGEWVPNPEAQYYSNTTCWAIHEYQNCMKFGRPDTEFLKWRWKPNGCELPIFDPFQFLEIVRGKSMAFVGDSVARNQMQSMICLLSRVEWPVDVSYTSDEKYKRWHYPSYNFTMAIFTSPFLVAAKEADPTRPYMFNLYLDEADEKWITQIEDFTYVILNGGHWFMRILFYYEKQKLIGSNDSERRDLTYLTMYYGYRRAFKTAFRAINSLKDFKGITFLRTFAPAHFENGPWNEGGNCVRTEPFKSSETKIEGINFEFHKIQMEEFKIAEKEGKKKGKKFRVLDITQAMWLRPDGHPSRYGHRPQENVPLPNDCVHWCLPGPIDTWSDFLLARLKMEGV
ncbi:hypothetical protein L6164_006574 [Bauhinia variegata]|uniref:Uncharacterized protein n=1 Tax=Bauhinia variegata TaxID=167791 RepID=A0ACB9Q0A0_BAUVA|nr:hypothetical protein L6164_006574 [Bauhinia variegata]